MENSIRKLTFLEAKNASSIVLKMKSLLLQVFEQIEKTMPKGMPKVIVDAERNRRILEKQANQLPWFEGGASSNSTKRVPKTTPNGVNKVPKCDPKCQIELARKGVWGAFQKSPKLILGAYQGRSGDIYARVRRIRGTRAAANYQRNR